MILRRQNSGEAGGEVLYPNYCCCFFFWVLLSIHHLANMNVWQSCVGMDSWLRLKNAVALMFRLWACWHASSTDDENLFIERGRERDGWRRRERERQSLSARSVWNLCAGKAWRVPVVGVCLTNVVWGFCELLLPHINWPIQTRCAWIGLANSGDALQMSKQKLATLFFCYIY